VTSKRPNRRSGGPLSFIRGRPPRTNNLAQTLADLDRHEEALAEARVAVGSAARSKNTSIRTLDAIVSRTGRGEQEWHR